MSMKRRDGSIQSANLPAYNRLKKNQVDRDFAIYRCMITKVHFVDDPSGGNPTYENRQVTYEAVILGGAKEGTILQNVKDGTSGGGGQYNFAERIFRPTSTKNLEEKAIAEQDGDIVFVQFIQGNTRAPLIVGTGVQTNDKEFTGASIEDGFITQSQYNGVLQLIDKNGNFFLTRKGGSLDGDSGVFVPDLNGKMIEFSLQDQALKVQFSNGMVINIDGATDDVKIKTNGGGEIHIAADRISIGNSSAELLQQISDHLQKVSDWATNVGATHTHLGNLSYSTSPPEQASDYITLGSNLSTIKGLVDQIKGSL